MTLFHRTWRLRDAFRNCFNRGQWRRDDGELSEDAEIVLRRLGQFCRANTSTFDADDRVHAMLEGRREVFLEIQNTINLTDAEILRLRKVDEVPDDE